MGAQGRRCSQLSTCLTPRRRRTRMWHAGYQPDPALKGFLDPNDAVAISFWIISIAMVAATVFFLMESMAVGLHWKTSMNVGALVTLVAAVHYFYMQHGE